MCTSMAVNMVLSKSKEETMGTDLFKRRVVRTSCSDCRLRNARSFRNIRTRSFSSGQEYQNKVLFLRRELLAFSFLKFNLELLNL